MKHSSKNTPSISIDKAPEVRKSEDVYGKIMHATSDYVENQQEFVGQIKPTKGGAHLSNMTLTLSQVGLPDQDR